MTWSWLWCWCRFMSASPGFHFWLLSGSRAHRDTCVPPITELWKFLGFKHCSLIHFHFHICYCYHRAELFCVSPQLLLLSLNMNTTMRTQFLCAIYLVAFDKSSLGKLHIAEDTISWYMKWYRTRIPKNVILKREKKFHRIVFGFSLISSFLAGLAGRYVAKLLTGLAAQQLPNF